MEKTLLNEGLKSKKKFVRNRKRLTWYIAVMFFPCLQFALFYFYVNFNTIILAFEKFAPMEGSYGYLTEFAGLENFKAAWAIFTDSGERILNSVYLFLANLVIVMSLALIFSYYIAKKYMFAGFFRVVLFLPHMVSGVVIVAIYQAILNDVVPIIGSAIFGEEALIQAGIDNGVMGIDAPAATKYGCILFYNIWIAFGTNVLLYTGAMSGVDPSIVESAQLDGANIVQEFLHIYIPAIFPTLTIFIVTGITGIFSNTMNMIAFYGTAGGDAPFDVFGYYMYRKSVYGSLYGTTGSVTYSVLSALGLIIVAIILPSIIIVRRLLEKYGPRTD